MSGSNPSSGARSWWLGQICDAVLLLDGVATQRPGAAIQITASVAGTVTLTLNTGSTIVVNPLVGDNLYPYQVVKAAAGTATITAYYNLFA